MNLTEIQLYTVAFMVLTPVVVGLWVYVLKKRGKKKAVLEASVPT